MFVVVALFVALSVCLLSWFVVYNAKKRIPEESLRSLLVGGALLSAFVSRSALVHLLFVAFDLCGKPHDILDRKKTIRVQ